MTSITGFTSARMQAIEDASVVDGDVVGNNLILTRFDGSTINAGSVRGPTGPTGPVAAAATIPIADVGDRLIATNVEAALFEIMLPVGSFIFGGWTTNPTGYFLFNGQRVINGAATYTDLAAMFPDWVDSADLVIPNITNGIPIIYALPDGTPGRVVSGFPLDHVHLYKGDGEIEDYTEAPLTNDGSQNQNVSVRMAVKY